jgi:crotonobetainyl-CoA:carnitine CoA-transferase CaiB-like acyl-CoA transferase
MTDDDGGAPHALIRDTLIVDMADELGSSASRLLADLGARVIKVERPGGDPSRSLGPFLKDDGFSGVGTSLSFAYHNTNKLGIIIDVERKEGRRSLRALLRQADVLIESFPAGYLGSLRLGNGSLKGINPGLIHLSITGFGKTGPKRGFPSCDRVLSAFSGQMYVSGRKGGTPLALPGSQSRYASSLFGALSVLLALRARRATGEGVFIDLSAQEALASTLDHVMVDYFSKGTIASRQGSVYASGLSSILPCRDGYIEVTILRNWETLVELIASEGKAEDLAGQEWQDEAYRIAHFDHIAEVVEKWTKGHNRMELFELGQAMRFPWAPLCSLSEVLQSPQLAARGFFSEIALPRGADNVPLPGLPFKISGFSQDPIKPAPSPGEHTSQVLAEFPAGRGKRRAARRNRRDPTLKAEGWATLTGLRVLDLTRVLAGPYATRILADFGAEVIKVQSSKTAQGSEENGTPYFAAWNRNKRSVTIDLGRPEARDLMLRLAACSDVVVENFSPRVMANWGLTYDALKEARPDVIMASISAAGQTGPWREMVAFGPTFHALSGLTSILSELGATPVCPGHAYGDTIIGLYAALAIVAALERRESTGLGAHIDLSGYEAVCTLLGPGLAEAAAADRVGVHPGKGWDGTAGIALSGCYPCLGDDRWCVIATFSDADWASFCRVVPLPELSDKRFSTAEGRKMHRRELDGLIGSWTIGNRAEKIVRDLQKAGVAAAVVQNAEDVARDRQLGRRGFFVPLAHEKLGTLVSDRSALSGAIPERKQWKGAPLLGADNDYVFGTVLGLTNEEIRYYKEKGVIG